jgi:6-phosphogluconolactonase (cycloisomerase 2 family)
VNSVPGCRIRAAGVVAVVLLGVTAVPSAAAEQPDPQPRLLYATNSGMIVPGGPPDGPHDTVTFTIGQAGGLTPFGAPAPGVTQPRGIVFSPNGRTAYIADSGGDAVAPFRVGDDGTLTPLSPPQPSGDLPFGIAMAPTGRNVYVAHFNSHDVAAFAVTDDGGLRPLGPPVKTGHDNGKGVAVTPDGRFLFVAHGTPVDQEPDVVIGFAIRPDGTLGAPGPAIPIGVSGSGVVITPDGRFLYVACQGSDEVWGFRIGRDGNLTLLPGMPQTAPDFSEGAAVAPNGRHLYVTALGGEFPDQDGVWAFAIGADGALTRLGERIATGDGPGAATATPDGRHLYISNFRSDDISAFDVLPSGGLRKLAGSPFPSGGEGPAFGAVMVSPNQGPVASFSATVRPAGRATRFDASASADRDGRIVRYDWDFGDGTVGTDAGPTPAHTYRHPGTFEVTVTVTDNEGCSTEFVFAGQSPLCTGSALARATRTVVITG